MNKTQILEQLNKQLFLTGAGTETYLVFQQGFDLPEFCAFVVHEDDEAWATLEKNYIAPTLRVAADNKCGLLFDALVWRAHPDFIARLGRDPSDLVSINQRAVARTQDCIERWRNASRDCDAPTVLITADIGPRGDGYQVEDAQISAVRAREYHQAQLEVLSKTDVDIACALTMTTAEESIGIVQASMDCELPIIVSPTVETDGTLPDGTSLGDFITKVDDETDGEPLCYMVNCAHPTHLLPTLRQAAGAGESWLRRFRGFRANASNKSHEELDNSTELDRGNVLELARHVASMCDEFDLRVVGGCCGTDHEHLSAIMTAIGEREK